MLPTAPAAGRGGGVLAPADALDAGDGHQPGHLVPPDLMPGLGHRVPHLADPVHVPVLAVQVDHHVDQDRFGAQGVGDRPPTVGVVAARGDLNVVLGEHPADRLDPELVPVLVDVRADHLSRRSSSAAAKNAADVRRISLARRSSPTSRRNRISSACSSVVVPGRTPASTSTRSIQPRRVSGDLILYSEP